MAFSLGDSSGLDVSLVAADSEQIIGAGKFGEHLGYIADDGRIIDAELPKTLPHHFQKKLLQFGIGWSFLHDLDSTRAKFL
jgi:hypothetical protein